MIVLFFIIIAGCTEIEPVTTTGQGLGNMPDQELFGATIRFTQAGAQLFTTRANHISRFTSKKLMLMEGGVVVDFFDGFGNHNARLTADQGEVRESENRLIARGDVVVKSDSGMVLMTEELFYDRNTEQVFSEDFVTIITPQDSVCGYGFTASSDLSNWMIENTSGATWRTLNRNADQGKVDER